MLRRIKRNALIFLALAVLVSLFFRSLSITLGVLAGGIMAVVNFRWIEAGHVVMHCIHHVPPSRATIIPDEERGSAGSVHEDTRYYPESEIQAQCIMAGQAAECILAGRKYDRPYLGITKNGE